MALISNIENGNNQRKNGGVTKESGISERNGENES
jgi:hypothetical protein